MWATSHGCVAGSLYACHKVVTNGPEYKRRPRSWIVPSGRRPFGHRGVLLTPVFDPRITQQGHRAPWPPRGRKPGDRLRRTPVSQAVQPSCRRTSRAFLTSSPRASGQHREWIVERSSGAGVGVVGAATLAARGGGSNTAGQTGGPAGSAGSGKLVVRPPTSRRWRHPSSPPQSSWWPCPRLGSSRPSARSEPMSAAQWPALRTGPSAPPVTQARTTWPLARSPWPAPA